MDRAASAAVPWAVVAVAVCGLLAACTSGNTATKHASFTPPSFPSASPTALLRDSAALVPLLAPPAIGGKAVGDPSELSLSQYVGDLYNPAYAPSEIASLEQDQVDGIAHLTWVTPEGPTVEDYLIHCATPSDAVTRFGELQALWSERPTIPVPGAPPHGQIAGYRLPGPNADGDDVSVVFAVRSHVVMSVYAHDLVPIDSAKLDTWAAAQIARLPS